ncbi:hypothetical protein [Pseudomonas phage ANB1]|nr:hypothetical protein [Pseudomonas phage ANB1]
MSIHFLTGNSNGRLQRNRDLQYDVHRPFGKCFSCSDCTDHYFG